MKKLHNKRDLTVFNGIVANPAQFDLLSGGYPAPVREKADGPGLYYSE